MKHTLKKFIFITSVFFTLPIFTSETPIAPDSELACDLFAPPPQKKITTRKRKCDDHNNYRDPVAKKAKKTDPLPQDVLGFLADILDAEPTLYCYAFNGFIKPAIQRMLSVEQYSQPVTTNLINHKVKPITQAMQPQAITLHNTTHTRAEQELLTNTLHNAQHISHAQTQPSAKQGTKKNNTSPALSLPAIITLLEKYTPEHIKPVTSRQSDRCFICDNYTYSPRSSSKKMFEYTCVRKHILNSHKDIIERALEKEKNDTF